MTITHLIGISASAFTSLTMLPQLIKILREHRTQGISWLMLVVLSVGLALWVVYGIKTQDLIIVIANVVSLVINLLTLFFVIIYRSSRKAE